jgi:arginase
MQGRYADALKAHINELSESRLLVHLDLDCLDTSVGQANEFAAPGGLTASDLVDCMRCIASGKEPVAMTIASFNPDLDSNTQIAAAAVAAVGVICERLGKRT